MDIIKVENRSSSIIFFIKSQKLSRFRSITVRQKFHFLAISIKNTLDILG